MQHRRNNFFQFRLVLESIVPRKSVRISTPYFGGRPQRLSRAHATPPSRVKAGLKGVAGIGRSCIFETCSSLAGATIKGSH